MIDPITEERALRHPCQRTRRLAHPQLQRRLHVSRDFGKHTLARPLAPDMDHHIVSVTDEPGPAPLKFAVQTVSRTFDSGETVPPRGVPCSVGSL